MSKVRSHSARSCAIMLPPPPMPALLNSRWIWSVSCCLATSAAKRLTSSSSETSATWVVMRRPCGRRSTSHSRLVSAIAAADTSHMATLQPSATSWRASSRPMPVPPPVMTAIRPARSFMWFPSLRCRPKVPRSLGMTRAVASLALPHNAARNSPAARQGRSRPARARSRRSISRASAAMRSSWRRSATTAWWSRRPRTILRHHGARRRRRQPG